jgi:hypothetical protein
MKPLVPARFTVHLYLDNEEMRTGEDLAGVLRAIANRLERAFGDTPVNVFHARNVRDTHDSVMGTFVCHDGLGYSFGGEIVP